MYNAKIRYFWMDCIKENHNIEAYCNDIQNEFDEVMI